MTRLSDPTFAVRMRRMVTVAALVVLAGAGVGVGVSQAASAPTNSSPPTITGPAYSVGVALTGSVGTWTGSGITYSYKWKRCNSAGASCSKISGAAGTLPSGTTTTQYTPVSADAGHTLRFAVTAKNAAGGKTVTSKPSPVIASGTAPANTAPPTISPSTGLQDGTLLTADPGTWTGTAPISYTYQWQRCAGGTCTSIGAPQTQASYLLTADDVGDTIVVVVGATNAANPGAPVTATSAATGTVAPQPISNTTPPSISGEPRVGSQLTALPGDWAGSKPLTFAFTWSSCTAPNSCVAVSPDPGYDDRYTPAQSDVDNTITVSVTATNAWDSTGQTAAAPPVGPVAPYAFTTTTDPAISGTAQVGSTLTVSDGVWTTTPTAIAYQWMQCDPVSNACVNEPKDGTSSSYLLRTYDKGYRIVAQVTATDRYGDSATASSAQTATVLASSTAVVVANWHMEDAGATMADSSVYGNDGTLTNVAVHQAGSTNYGFGFSGSPSNVTVPSDPSLNPRDDALSVLLHVRFATAPPTAVGDYDLLRKGLATDTGGDYKVEIMPTGQARCYAAGSAGSISLIAGPNLADDAWHSIRCLLTQTSTASTMKLNVDGSAWSKSTTTIGTIGNTADLRIGAKDSSTDQYAGLIDEVVVKMGG